MVDTVTILAVDDLEMNREMLKVILAEAGYEIITADDGAAALQILSANRNIDTVILDLEMPDVNGFQVLAAIRNNPLQHDIPVIVTTACDNEVLTSLSLGANDFLTKPYNPEELKLRVRNHVRIKKLNDLAMDMNAILEKEVVKKTTELQKSLDFSKKTEYEISLRLGKVSEFRDVETGMHIRRISEFSSQLARLHGLSAAECETLRFASPLHDVGKIGIPDNILLKPGKLTEAEFEIMKSHTIIGGTILADADEYPLLSAGATVALQHHERWDGSGYPNRLAGSDIHVFARIVAIVDVFDALTSERPYKKAFPVEESVRLLAEGKGTHFDPHLLDLFLANLDLFIAIKDELRDSVPQHAAEYLT